jgi:Protein of unknown function (DUF3108)
VLIFAAERPLCATAAARPDVAQIDWLSIAMTITLSNRCFNSIAYSRPNRLRISGGVMVLLASMFSCTTPSHARDAAEAWPATVHAKYRINFLGIDVGHIEMTSTTTSAKYAMSGSGKVSALLGAVVWTGKSSVSGVIENGAPVPTAYTHDIANKKKSWGTEIRYKDRNAPEVILTPPPGEQPPEFVPLTPANKVGAFDPLSALMMLTKADGKPPCARRLPIFDGKHRYDLVFSFKRMTRLPLATGKDTSEVGIVCRVIYEPIAGYKANEDTKAYTSNRDTEVILRRIPGTEMLIPHSVTVSSAWGSGSMTAEQIDVTTAAGGKVLVK